MALTDAPIDPQDIEASFGQVFELYRGALLNYMIDIGHRTGLLVAAAAGRATSEGLAARAGLTERYVREWLGAMVTGGIVDYDPADETYLLPPAFAVALTGGPMPLANIAAMNTLLGRQLGGVARAFREGGGVPYAAFRPEFTDCMDQMGRAGFDMDLVSVVVPLAGLHERLEGGCRVADFCCGTGHALVVLAEAYPASTFSGYDLDDGAIARARAEAAGAKLTNVRFEVADVARLGLVDTVDIAFVFDAIHDQVDPAAVLAAIAAALAPGGTFVAREPHAGDTLADNLGNPMATVQYCVSTLHCLTVSLAHDGAGIGTAFGEGLARELLAAAGFVDVQVHPYPGDPMDALYVSQIAGGAG